MDKKPSPRRRLPDDIEVEILLRLPVKTLKRFECACKSWSSLISSPQFQNDHFRRSQQNPLLLTLQDDSNIFDPTLGFSVCNKDGSHVKKFSKPVRQPYFARALLTKPDVQSCQGLVCISSLHAPILVCNPTTEEAIALPYLEESNYCFGFGYAPSSEEFKVVRFAYSQGMSGCEVFTFGSSHWRKTNTPPYDVSRGTAPFLHGALHFLPVLYHRVEDARSIAAFDIETEDYRGIRLPEYFLSFGDWEGHNFLTSGALYKLGGALCLTLDFGKFNLRVELWILKDYKNVEWVKGYIINISSASPGSFHFRAFPVDNTHDQRILLNCADQLGFKVLTYNTEDGVITLKKVEERVEISYVESLYSLTGRGLHTTLYTSSVIITCQFAGRRKSGSVPVNKYYGDSEDDVTDHVVDDGDNKGEDDTSGDKDNAEEGDEVRDTWDAKMVLWECRTCY